MPAPAAPSVDWHRAELVNATPTPFEAAFDRARPTPDASAGPIAFAALVGGSNIATVEKFARAIAHVRAEKWLHQLIEQIVAAGEIPGVRALLEAADAQGSVKAGSTLA